MNRLLFCTALLTLTAGFVQAESGRDDYDRDNDGLIEINDLADLHEIRNNLDGSSLYGSSKGCPEDGCIGFELTTDLDFDTNGDGVLDEQDEYWNDGSGWEPVGDDDNRFQAVFEGNGHVIRNLYIDRPHTNYQGLFGHTENARIQNIGLTGPLMSVRGGFTVGALVGYSSSTVIEATFNTGPVQGGGSRVGGLVGYLTGESQLKVVFSTGSVTGDSDNVGGLVGSQWSGGDIHSSYAAGRVEGASDVGGLIGGRGSSSVETSYWATDLSGQSESNGGVGAKLSELQCPEAADDETCSEFTFYEQWGDSQDSEGNAYWDFGTDEQLPALVLNGKTYRDSDGDGVLDEEDDFPFNPAASVDTDGDGHPDAWNLSCDSACREASGLVLDQFPDNPAAALDTDLDGMPEEWNSDCDPSCQDDSGLTLDTHPDDVDNDGVADSEHPHADGLMDIESLEDLNAIRYSLEEVGRRESAEDELDITGCPAVVHRGTLQRRCHGYELTRDLDFDTNGDGVLDEQDEYWNNGAGWEPVGDEDNRFQAVFEGNGHVIRNLYIDRPNTSDQGLFGETENARIQNLSLTGSLMSVSGDWSVGALVGYSDATIIEGVFSTGPVRGDGFHVGGLIGYFRGWGQLRAAFSTGSVTGESYYVGGLVGYLHSGDVQSSYATGRVEGSTRTGGLIGSRGSSASVETSYWATDLSGQSGSDGGVGAELLELQCPVDANDDSCAELTLYEQWGQVEDADGNAYWDFGTDEQLPALVLNGKTYRDSDGDGVLDEEDDLPLNPAASVDTDGDGRPDSWNEDCDDRCQSDSGLELDPDRDGDGVDNEEDAFPTNPAASVDTDGDGRPDNWNEDCDAQCQSDSGLELDPDRDGDGVDNETDAFPANAAASVDDDQDGLPDDWHESCNADCQEESGLTLDEHLNDTDNDGVVNEEDHYPTDPDRWQDDVAPEMVLVPEPMHVASTGELTEVTLKVEDAGGYDSFSESVSFRVYHDEERLAWDDEYRVELPVGKVILNWVAVDNAGNESAPMPQTVNVYPQVSFTESESATGEGNAARVKVSLSGPSPVYPVTLMARWVEADSTASAEDVLTEGEGAVDLNELTAVIESEEALAEAGFVVPIVQDDQSEMDEQLVLTLQAAHAGEETEESTEEGEGQEGRFEMPLLEQGTDHTLTITEANLAPTLALRLEQDGERVDVVRQDGGEVTVEATITDANGGDEHQLEWYTGDLPFVVDNTEHRFAFDPMDLDAGEYTISALVSDNGDPALSSEEITLGWDVEAADSDKESDETEEAEDEGTGEGETDNGADDEETGNVGSDAGSNGGSGGGGGSVHIGALLLLLMLALARTGLARRRP